MKKILITGKGSYIGTSLIKWLETKEEEFYIAELSVRGEEWKSFDFSKFDTLVHVAGIAHQKETTENEHLYYEVNRDLAFEVAKKAKNAGIKHFVFLSTMSVYGKQEGRISSETVEKPLTHYGKAKYEAEKIISELANTNFNVSILRPPMVYGKNAKGNYSKLSNFIKKTKIFPNKNNQRSMIYIYNLCEFIHLVIKHEIGGVLFPQNSNYVDVKNMAKIIGKYNKININFIPNTFNLFTFISKNITVGKKVLGNLYYDQSLSMILDNNNNQLDYNPINFEESIKETEIIE